MYIKSARGVENIKVALFIAHESRTAGVHEPSRQPKRDNATTVPASARISFVPDWSAEAYHLMSIEGYVPLQS